MPHAQTHKNDAIKFRPLVGKIFRSMRSME